jgi:hypothetical protein
MEPVTAIPDIGPATAAAFARAGTPKAAALRAMGADAADAALPRARERPHFVGYYALVMGLQGRPRNDARGAEKAALRARFEVLKAEPVGAGPAAGIEPILNEIGLVPPGRR